MKTDNLGKIMVAALLIGITLMTPAGSRAQVQPLAEPPQTANGLEMIWMYEVRLAALHGDRSQLPKMIEELHKPHTYDYVITLLLAAARLGDTEALPAIDSVLQENKDPYVQPFAQVARARLLAENAAASVKDPQQKAKIKIDRFYQELSLTPDAINAGARTYKADVAQKQREKYPFPLEVRAMADLADMVYLSIGPIPGAQPQKQLLLTQTTIDSRAAAQTYPRLPGIANVDFTIFPEDALKIRLAPLSHAERIKTLVYELGHESMDAPIVQLDVEDTAKAQLLADEGIAARPAIVRQLMEMVENRNERFKRREGGNYFMLDRALKNITGEDFDYRVYLQNKANLDKVSNTGNAKLQIKLDY